MSNFVLSFRSAPDASASQAENEEWGAWFRGLAGTVVDMGSRVGVVTMLGASTGASVLTGYCIIEADDLATALDIANGCPGLKYDGSVEVGELIAM